MQLKNNETTRMNGKGKHASSSKGKHKLTEQHVAKKSSKSSKTSEKLAKASDVADATAPFREIKNNHQRLEHKASNVSLDDQHKATALEQSAEGVEEQRNNFRSSDNKAAKFLEKCELSKHLKASKRKLVDKEFVPIELPQGLPSKVLLKALLQEQQSYTILREQVIQLDQDDNHAIDVHLDSINMEQLTTLVKELDELVGQFTARN